MILCFNYDPIYLNINRLCPPPQWRGYYKCFNLYFNRYVNRETLPDGSLGHISGFPPGDGQGVILQGSRFAYRKIWVAQVDETSEGIDCPLDLVKDWVEVQCWRPSTGRTTTSGASGVFTLRGIILRKLTIKIWINKCACSVWEYYSCLSSRGSSNI